MGMTTTGAGGVFSPAQLPGLLAEYDFLQGANPSLLYDRKPGGGADGSVGAGASYSSVGLATGGAAGWAASAVAGNAAKTALLFLTPQAASSANVMASLAGVGVQSALFLDLPGDVPNGVLYPRFRDLNTGATVWASYAAAARWPLMIGLTLGTPAALYLNDRPAQFYDQQDNGSLFTGSASPLGMGNNFLSNGVSTDIFHYALFFSGVLTPVQVSLCYGYMAGKVWGRAPTVAGPAALAGDLLCLTGNSLTSLIDVTQVTPTVSFAKVKVGLAGLGPSQVVALARQSSQLIRRPKAARNYLTFWPTPLTLSATDVDTYIVPFVAEMRGQGWRVAVPTAISASGFDSTKNLINAKYDSLMAGANPPFDRLIDLRPVTEVSADGAYSNATYFSDGTHPTTGNSGTNTGYGKIYPVLVAGINAMG